VLVESGGTKASIYKSPRHLMPAPTIVCASSYGTLKEPWCKKLAASGTVIAATEEEARAVLAQVEFSAEAGKKEGGSFAPFGVEASSVR
jgi:hypothetical protein